jgi:hypothetical protein
MKNHD